MNRKWEDNFSRSVRKGDIDSSIRVLQSQNEAALQGSRSLKERAINLILQGAPEGKLSLWARRLVRTPLPIAQEVGCSLLGSSYAKEPKTVSDLLVQVADDPDWEAREWAAYIFAFTLSDHFDEIYPLFTILAKHDSPNVRRAVVVGAKYSAKARDAKWGRPLLKLIEPLLQDRNEYVRKNLGPFAIGDGLLRCYPELTLTHLRAWAKSKNEVVRWNVAMSFSTAESRKHLASALLIFRSLASDDRRFVWRAVAAAMKNHARWTPERVLPVITKWSRDPTRKHVAEVVLKYAG